MASGFPEVRDFDFFVERYVVAYKKTHKHLSTLDVGVLPETRTEKAQFCRAVTTSLLIEFAIQERDNHAVFEKAIPKEVVVDEVVSQPSMSVGETKEVLDSTVKESSEPPKMNPHDNAGLCSYYGKKLIEEEKIDPVRVISRRLDARTLPRGTYAMLMQLKDDYKVQRWQDIDSETLACFVYAEELMQLPSDKIPDGDVN